MRKTRFLQSLSLVVCAVLIAAMALCTTGCNDNTEVPETGNSTTTTITTTTTVGDQSGNTVLGTGEKSFHFITVDTNGAETAYEIHTDAATVGEALLNLKLIDGEQGPYGLYVKTVNGVTVDYDTDGKYWAFFVNGEYASSGVDTTDITDGATYSFNIE